MIFSYLLNMQSHPSWVCGLKLSFNFIKATFGKSHPSWVCGLKQELARPSHSEPRVTPFVGVWIETVQAEYGGIGSDGHTLRGCVD